MGTLFGTDGVRGLANADLTPELALALGRAAVGVLLAEGSWSTGGLGLRPPDPPAGAGRPAVVVGRDPRVKERKKAGLKKARKRPQFSKR